MTPDINYLSPFNPRLLRLIEEYRALDYFDHSMWRTWPERVDLQNFRREGDYLAQLDYGMSEQKYWATLGYVGAVDDQNYLSLFSEDDLFGVVSFLIAGRRITRDLLDSVLEINFLRAHLGAAMADGLEVLDIGAGYGRFAHRLVAAFPKSRVRCVDAVPQSTFICEHYVKFRNFSDRAEVVSLGQVVGMRGPIDIAVNIHSWSECTLKAINFWLDLITDLRVKHIFVVPHSTDFFTMETDGTRLCFLPTLKAHGYGLIRAVPKYSSPSMQDVGLYPTTYYLFQRG